MDAIMNAISIDSTTWIGIGAVMGGCFGAIITFWVAEGIGFRQGVLVTQKHHEVLAAQKHGPEQELTEGPTEIPAPKENIEAGELVTA